MKNAPNNQSRLILLGATMAIVLFCVSAAIIITGWMPHTVDFPYAIAAIQ